MSSPADHPSLTKQQLFQRLAEGAVARLTVITPNRRLANALMDEFDAAQQARGLNGWETADVLPQGSFIERLYEDALYSGSASSPRLPLLLAPAQEQVLWENIIAQSEWGSALLAPARTAESARKAWMMAHQWRMDGMLGHFPGNEDALAFAAWATHYRRRTAEQHQTDTARLPDLVATLLAEPALRRPDTLVLYAFDIVTPQLTLFLSACASAGTRIFQCRAEHRAAQVQRLPLPSARAELEHAAHWARARLEASVSTAGPAAAVRIGIVVPDLEQRRKQAMRIFARALRPDYDLPGAAAMAAPFNLSLGLPLTQYPLVHAALGMLALAQGSVDFALASRLLRSPFLGGALSEAMARAKMDAALRRVAPPRLGLAKLIAVCGSTAIFPPRLSACLRDLLEAAQAQPQGTTRRAPHDWAGRYSALLKVVGFPGERPLDSTEFQTLAKWNEVLAEFAALTRVAPAMSATEALARLTRLCADSLFQAESGSAPIQVLGVLESAGLGFDHLWICGLTDEAWPLAARPHPFISPALQKKAGVPEASAETALALDRRITEHWLGAAAEVVISHPLREDDRELSPSPLIAAIAEGRPALPDYADLREALYASRAFEAMPETAAPPLEQEARRVRGGARVLADQAACPFRAFAAHRLAAEPLRSPAGGLDAAARGNLLHALMKNVWDELKTQATLNATGPDELDALLARSAAAAVERIRRDVVIEDALAALERERLHNLAREWLQIERRRAPFEVVASEEKRELAAGGLVLSGRIDRMDRLEDGSHVLIDYKTGRATPKWWEGERPEDPQLPLYAANAPERVSAVAFAKLKTGGMRFMGHARDPSGLPGVKQYHDWDGLLAGWKQDMHGLGAAFMGGEAGVDPKRPGQSCRYCALHPLCRVHERYGALVLDEGAENAAADESAEGDG